VNAVVLRLALTLGRCGEDPRAIFSALIGAAATIATEMGVDVDQPEELRQAIESVMAFGDLRGFSGDAPAASGSVIPFPRARVA
ncbi:MAG: hypothetical protein ABW275_12145, partial [Hansschlegelia sp.]